MTLSNIAISYIESLPVGKSLSIACDGYYIHISKIDFKKESGVLPNMVIVDDIDSPSTVSE